MVNSTPIIIRSLTKVFPQNFRDLTLIAGTIGDYAALVVPEAFFLAIDKIRGKKAAQKNLRKSIIFALTAKKPSP